MGVRSPHFGIGHNKDQIIFFDRKKKFKFENPDGQNLNLKMCNGQKFKSVTVIYWNNLML